MNICGCGGEFKPHKIGMIYGQKTEKGIVYKLWSCDRLICRECKGIMYVTANRPMISDPSEIAAGIKAAKDYGIYVEGVYNGL